MFRYVPRILIATLLVALSAFAAAPPKLDEAIAAQRQRIAERPDDAVVHNDLANLLVAGGRMTEAEAAYDRAIVLAPNAPAVRFNRALLLHQLARLEEAEADYLLAVEWEPNYAWAHYQLGRLAAERGQKDRAISSYARAFALDTELALAEVNPHVIDNAFLTEALLQARSQGGGGGAQVPREYGEGERIADLLLARRVEGERPDEAAEPAAEGKGKKGREGSGREKKSTDSEADEESAPRVVDSSSLDRGSSTGQAKPSGAASSFRGVAPQRSPVRVRSTGHQIRRPPTPSTPPRTAPPPPSRVGGTAPSRAPSLGQTSVRGSVPRYRPSRRSTSSLGLDLLPGSANRVGESDLG